MIAELTFYFSVLATDEDSIRKKVNWIEIPICKYSFTTG